jgi:hypothetical protein
MEKTLEEQIIELHLEGKKMRVIERMVGCSFSKVMDTVSLIGHEDEMLKTYPIIEGKNLYAVCKKTSREFIDYKNICGAITTHLKELDPSLKVDTNFKRKALERKTKKYWFHDYFDFIHKDIVDIPTVKCRYCNWETEDIDNLYGAYSNHVKNVHNISGEEHIKTYPEDIKYFKYITKALKTPEHTVKCLVCGEMFLHVSSIHLKTHGLTKYEYLQKYNLTTRETISDTSFDKMVDQYNITLKGSGFVKQSKAELEIIDILNDNNINFKTGDRKILNGLEIDILIEDKKIGIEYNGIFYHTEIGGKKSPTYHLDKLKNMNRAGYNLIQIFEDEWMNKKDIVISKLLHIIGVSDKPKLYARNLIIKEIESNQKTTFLNKFHIQGTDASKVKIGAFYGDILVSVMTFDNTRSFNKSKTHNENVYDLKRFATSGNYRIIGIASKMLKYFITKYNPETIVSFADRRWTLDVNINLYTNIGFVFDKFISPDYHYFNSSIARTSRLHKFGYGKSSLKKKYPDKYNENKTEWEMMQEFGFDRIWDCGLIRYVYRVR